MKSGLEGYSIGFSSMDALKKLTYGFKRRVRYYRGVIQTLNKAIR